MRPSATTSVSPAGDLPPKYEDLEDCPPQYDESTMRNDAALDTVEGREAVNDTTSAEGAFLQQASEQVKQESS